jgi:hypothetical protein
MVKADYERVLQEMRLRDRILSRQPILATLCAGWISWFLTDLID